MGYQKPAHISDDLFVPGNPWENMGSCPHEYAKKLFGDRDLVFVQTHVHPGKALEGVWITVSAEATRQIFKDTESFSSVGATFFSTFLPGLTFFPVEVDPPQHTKYRAIVAEHFRAARVKDLSGAIAARADSLLDGLISRGGCEFMSEFAKIFPAMIFLDLMGLPNSRAPEFLALAKRAFRSPDPEEKTAAMRQIQKCLAEEIEARRASPADGALSAIANGEIDGRKLTMDEAVGGAMVVFIAGLDTVASQLGWVFRQLAEDQELQAQLRRDPSNLAKVHEEFLRFFASVMMVNRIATRDVRIGDAFIKKGDAVACSPTLACRDEKEFENAGRLDLSTPPRRHLAFGHGVHTCIGLHLARLELKTVTERWFERVPTFRIKSDATFQCRGGAVLALDSLPLVWS
ncbi:MAG: cytochrome P450 [Parvularculaceae bacterium]